MYGSNGPLRKVSCEQDPKCTDSRPPRTVEQGRIDESLMFRLDDGDRSGRPSVLDIHVLERSGVPGSDDLLQCIRRSKEDLGIAQHGEVVFAWNDIVGAIADDALKEGYVLLVVLKDLLEATVGEVGEPSRGVIRLLKRLGAVLTATRQSCRSTVSRSTHKNATSRFS